MHTGRIVRGIKPSWEPLLELVGAEVVPGFMWMYALELDDGVELHAYKSVTTRRYLYLARGGRVFASHGGERYAETDALQALEEVFEGWEGALPQPRNPDAVHALFERLRAAAAPEPAG